MDYKKIVAQVLGLSLLLGLTTSIVGCETAEPELEEEDTTIEEPLEEETEVETEE
ncbi:hypothetical protein [Myxosarcina sp. GI1(2024)]